MGAYGALKPLQRDLKRVPKIAVDDRRSLFRRSPKIAAVDRAYLNEANQSNFAFNGRLNYSATFALVEHLDLVTDGNLL